MAISTDFQLFFVNAIIEFKNKVNTALTGSATTEIGSDYVISPKIGGGYLHIANGSNHSSRLPKYPPSFPYHDSMCGMPLDLSNKLIMIPLLDKTKDGYLFCIRNKNKSENDVIMGVTKDGNGYFSGEINATHSQCTYVHWQPVYQLWHLLSLRKL